MSVTYVVSQHTHLTRGGGSVVEFFSGGLKNNQLLNAIPGCVAIDITAENSL